VILRALAIVAGLAGCEPGRAAVSRGDCEAVLAHLVALERDVSEPAVCKYHGKCEGSEEARYLEQCPRVLSRREVGCYQRATSLRAAEACLPLVALAARIDTGQRGEAEDDDARDGGAAWIRPGDRAALMLRELEQIRDATCACTDATCRVEAQDRMDRWMSGFATLQNDQTSTEIAMKLFRDTEACRTGGGGLDAGVTGALPSCQVYILLIEKMSTCSGIPQSSRDSLLTSLPQLRDAYDATNMSADVQQQIDASCAQGLDSLRDQLRTLGCL